MNEVVTKKLLADLVAEKANTTKKLTKKDAQEILNIVFDEIKNELKDGNKVDIAGFGKFEVKHKAERNAINPATQERVVVPAKNVPTFKPAKGLKEAI